MQNRPNYIINGKKRPISCRHCRLFWWHQNMPTIFPILFLSNQTFSLIEPSNTFLFFQSDHFLGRMSSKLNDELITPTDPVEFEMKKVIRETMEMLLDKTTKANPAPPLDFGDFTQNGPSEIGRLVIAECSSAECSKSNSPMPEGPTPELQFKGTSMPMNGSQPATQMPVGAKTMSKVQLTPKMTAYTTPLPTQFTQSSSTTITLKKMPIQPTPVAKILPKPPAASQAAKMQQQLQEQPKSTQSQTDQKPMATKITTKLIRICATTVAASEGTTTAGPKMVMANSTTKISTQIPSQIIGQNLQNFGQNGDNQIAANNRPSLFLPIRPKIRKNSNANNGAKMAATTSTPATSNTSNMVSKIDQITEDHLAATVNKVAAGVEISPKQEEKILLPTNTESAQPVPPTVPAPDKSKAAAKLRKKKPAASILPVSISNGANISAVPMGMGGSCAFSFPNNVQSQPQIITTSASSTGIFATATHNPQFALAPNGNLMAVTAGGMTHYLIRQQPNPATSTVSGHFIPFIPPGQFFISPVHQISELKQQINTNNCFGQKGTAIGSDISYRGLNGPTTTSFPSNYPSTNLCAAAKANKHHSQIVRLSEMIIDNSPQTNCCFGGMPPTIDEEENEPPPVLDKPQPTDDEPEPAMMPQNGGNGDTARLLESIFQKEAKIIRDRFTGSNGRKGGPIVHEIDGFRIEEDIEPFPVENKKLLDTLKEGKSLTNSPEEKEETKNVEKKKKATATKSQETLPTVGKKGRLSEGAGSSTVATGSSISSSAKVKGRKRELQGLLEMDFGPGKTPFQTSDPDEYTEEVLIEAKKHARLMSEERPHSSSSKSKRDNKERSSQQAASANKEKRTPIGQQKEGGNDKNGSSGERRRGNRSSSMEYESEEEGHCHNCGKSFEEVGRCQGHEQYCSRECHKAMKKKRKKLKNNSREESMNNMNGTGVNINDESPSATNSTTTANSQQKWISPLGSAFAAVQPQISTQTLSNVGRVGVSPNSSDPQTSNASMFFAPAGPSQSLILQNQQQIQHQTQQLHQIVPNQMSYPQHISPPHHYLGPMPSNYFHPQFAHAAAAQQIIQPAGSSASTTAFFGHFSVPGAIAHQPPQSSNSAGGFHHRSPPQLGQSPPLTPGTLAIPGKIASEIDLLLVRGIHSWTPDEVAKWVNFVTNSSNNGETFVQQEIDGSSLLLLNCEQLQNELKLKLGPAVKLQNALNSHKTKYHLL